MPYHRAILLSRLPTQNPCMKPTLPGADNLSIGCFHVTVLLILTSQRIEFRAGTRLDEIKELRGSTPTFVEWIIIGYVAGKSIIGYVAGKSSGNSG